MNDINEKYIHSARALEVNKFFVYLFGGDGNAIKVACWSSAYTQGTETIMESRNFSQKFHKTFDRV